MSIKLGVYIGRWRNLSCEEYRVAVLDNIEDTDDPFNADLFQAALFGNSQIHREYVTALSQACQLMDDYEQVHGIVEYGLVEKYYDKPFPNVSVEEAQRQLSEFYGDEYTAD